jgi:hypothetical protein
MSTAPVCTEVGRWPPATGMKPRQEAVDRQIALAGVVVEAQHPRSRGQLGQLLRDGGQGRAAGDADEQALLTGTAAGVLARGLGLDLDDAVQQGRVQHRWDEARADALDGVRARLATTDDR